MGKNNPGTPVSEPGKEVLLDRLRLVLWSDHQGLVATLLVTVLLSASVYFAVQWNASKGLVDIDEATHTQFLFQVDLNTASVGELVLLPGVGPKLGQSILAHRDERGRFEYHAELLTVPGIGEKKYQAIRPFLSPLEDGEPQK
jgi:competence ComEA-like helix-hairpin-helix protein